MTAEPVMAYSVTVRVEDDDGGVGSTSMTVTVKMEKQRQNHPPQAVAGGPYVGDEGSPIVFDVTGSSDPDGGALQYRWDFNDDGVWDTVWSSVSVATYSWIDDWTGTVVIGDLPASPSSNQ